MLKTIIGRYTAADGFMVQRSFRHEMTSGLSCLGMMAVDLLFHTWHSVFFPLCQPVSYVDDWTLLTSSAVLIPGAYECLQRFVAAVDLMLDTKKTFAWSVSSSGRKTLQDAGLRVETHCRVLGAHVQASRKHTNVVQMDRVRSISKMWPKLRLSAAPYDLKVRAIKTAAWPRTLKNGDLPP